MSSTYLRLYYHILFSTKYRQKLIAKSWQELFYLTINNQIKNFGASPEAIGGISDHIHLLMALRSSHCLANIVKDLKYHSCRWVHTEIKLTTFAWQTGYSAFTVSYSGVNAVKNYINNQKQHHQNKSFEYKLSQFLYKNDLF